MSSMGKISKSNSLNQIWLFCLRRRVYCRTASLGPYFLLRVWSTSRPGWNFRHHKSLCSKTSVLTTSPLKPVQLSSMRASKTHITRSSKIFASVLTLWKFSYKWISNRYSTTNINKTKISPFKVCFLLPLFLVTISFETKNWKKSHPYRRPCIFSLLKIGSYWELH